jgi:hypothetical protein
MPQCPGSGRVGKVRVLVVGRDSGNVRFLCAVSAPVPEGPKKTAMHSQRDSGTLRGIPSYHQGVANRYRRRQGSIVGRTH